MCISIVVCQDTINGRLLCPDGVFFRSERTLAKRSSSGVVLKAKKVQLALQMIQFMAALMIGKGATEDGVRPTRYLGPVKVS